MDSKALVELEDIRLRNGGAVSPYAVVERAKPKSNPLHKYFEWDNKKASHNYRLWQARMLIRVTVITLPNTTEEIRAYVSLLDDRNNEGGYRATIDVLENEDWCRALLTQAYKDFMVFKNKYNQLVEFAPVFEAYDKIAAVKD